MSDGSKFIVVSGPIEFGDDLRVFETLLISSRPTVVTFDSPGGSVSKAMELGRLRRRHGLSSVQLRELECASACAPAFLGGVTRYAEPGSIGVHQSSFGAGSGLSTDEALREMQRGTAVLIGYLNEMGVDAGLLEVALSYESSDMRYLSASEMARFRVTTGASPPASATPKVAEPLPTPKPSSPTISPKKPARDNVKREVANFVRRVVSFHMINQASALSSSYADSVNYYGKPTPRFEVIQDKERYFARWPERTYRLKDETISIDCRPFACDVSGQYSWAVQSIPRNRKASGLASFRYVVQTWGELRIS